MPSQYYKLRGLEGVSGGQFTDDVPAAESSAHPRGPSLAESFNQRVIGSRFQEVNRNSVAYGRLPIGSQVIIDRDGQVGAVPFSESPIPDAAPYGTGAAHTSWDTAAFNENPLPPHQWWTHQPGDSIQEEPELTLGEDWVDILSEVPEAFENAEEYNPKSTPPRRRPRPPRPKPAQGSEDRRETFPLRRGEAESEEQPPPHLRVQPRGPFVRPLSGLDHGDLGHIYADINMWRAKLKSINNEIGEVQSECYKDIADGARIKGWLMVGRGLRFIPGIELIEGRAKEDIRWNELQNEGGPARTLAFWTIAVTVAILLGICCKLPLCTAKARSALADIVRSDWRGRPFCCDSAGLWSLFPLLPSNIFWQCTRSRCFHMLGRRICDHGVHWRGGVDHAAYVH